MLDLIIFGPPGSGKGTQSAHLLKKYGLLHISTGDLLRQEIKDQTKLGLEAQAFMDKGLLVPDQVVCSMIENKVTDHPGQGLLLDGFPRTKVQAGNLDDLLKKYDRRINAVISLDVPRAELIQRLLERGKDSGRADDANEEVIEKRLTEYNDKTKEVADHYSSQEVVHGVHGVGTVEEIFEKITQVVDQLS